MLILASGSPRRRELLHQIGVEEFQVLPAQGEEEAPEGLTPGELVEHLALQKALEVQQKCSPEDVILAADTIVTIDGTVLGKPRDEAHAREMLQALSGGQHQVYSGVAVLRGEARRVSHEVTDVFFREMTGEEIDWYISTGEPMDKAGSYGIQGLGGRFIPRIEGDYSNVVGLPLCKTAQLLEELS